MPGTAVRPADGDRTYDLRTVTVLPVEDVPWAGHTQHTHLIIDSYAGTAP